MTARGARRTRKGWNATLERDLRDQGSLPDVCPDCGKRQYTTKRAARRAARTLYPGDKLQAYPGCVDGLFHIGHLPYWKRIGETA